MSSSTPSHISGSATVAIFQYPISYFDVWVYRNTIFYGTGPICHAYNDMGILFSPYKDAFLRVQLVQNNIIICLISVSFFCFSQVFDINDKLHNWAMCVPLFSWKQPVHKRPNIKVKCSVSTLMQWFDPKKSIPLIFFELDMIKPHCIIWQWHNSNIVKHVS